MEDGWAIEMGEREVVTNSQEEDMDTEDEATRK